MVDKGLIKRRFSAYADTYDAYASVQNLCAAQLIAFLGTASFTNILDIGCGTGNYTKLLRKTFPRAKIGALDISDHMIAHARKKLISDRIDFITADAETALFDSEFDCVTSNASFQWFDNLKEVFTRYSGFMKEGGTLSFSIFGPGTFAELQASLRSLYGHRAELQAGNFTGASEVEALLRDLFREVIVKEERYTEENGSLLTLLRKIKYTGTTGTGIVGNGLWTRRTIDTLEKIYRERFGSVIATYEVLFCRAVR